MESGISIVGAGRVGRALGRRLREKGWKIHSVVTSIEATARRAVRSIGSGRASGGISAGLLTAPLILIAVPEHAMDYVVGKLAGLSVADLRGKTALHTHGGSVGSIHPLQALRAVGVPSLDGTIFDVESDSRAVGRTRSITGTLGARAVQSRASRKPVYHAVAVIAAGRILAMEEAAIQLFVSLGLKRNEALESLLPLTRQVLENLRRVGPSAAWTGPLARGDYGVIAKHEKALPSAPIEFLDAYRAVNRLVARVLAHDLTAVLAELEKTSVNEDSLTPTLGVGA